MKILFLGEYDSAEIVPAPIKVGKEIFKAFNESGHHIYYLSYFQDGKIYSRVQKLFGFQRITEKVYRTGIFAMIIFVIKFRPHIIQFITPATYYFTLLLLKFFLKFKIIYLNHSIISIMNKKYLNETHYDKMRFKIIEKLAFRYCNRIFVLSKLEARFLRIYLKVPKERIEIVKNGIALYNINKKYNNYSAIVKIITVGSVERKEKGIELLIKALGQINKSVELTICNYEKQEKFTHKSSESLNIIIKSPLNENSLRQEIVKHDLFIIPSEYEPFNISLLEAMNTGIIILASSRVGLTERFGNDLKSLIFRYNEENDLLDHIDNFLKMKNEAKINLSYKIREFSENYSWTTVTEEYRKIYNRILTR